MEKNEIRIKSLEKRKLLNCIQLSKKIINNLFLCEEYQSAKNVLCYYPLKYEVDTRICFEDKTKNWYLPRVNGELLEICPYKDLQKGSFGILEPKCMALNDYSIIDSAIIPCCAADKSGYRIGYGKGFYDRFLPSLNQNCKKIILLYSDLLFDNIYPEKHDIHADLIVTDKEILRI